MATGVFGLRKVYIKQNENIDNRNFTSWSESAVYGYVAGGLPPANATTLIERLDFSSEVVSLPGKNLSPIGTIRARGTFSSLYGYFGGGFNPGPLLYINTITRLDFSNETVSNPGKNFLSVVRDVGASISGNLYGYYASGTNTAPGLVYTSVITRLDFSNETVSEPGSINLPISRDNIGSLSSSSYGYFGGGYFPTPVRYSTITRLDFSSETISDPGKNLPTARSSFGGMSSVMNGYFGGGIIPAAFINTISRLDFSNESITNLSNGLPTLSGKSTWTGTSSISYGYVIGGLVPGYTSNISRLDFSTEITSDLVSKLSSSRGAYGLVSGGQSINRGSKTYGYFVGGITPPTTYRCLISRLDFSNETMSDPAKDLSYSAYGMAAISNNYYGYFGGGTTAGGQINTISRLDFSNETTSLPGKNLPVVTTPAVSASQIREMGSVSSSFYGYFGGGIPTASPPILCNIIRFDFSTEDVILTQRFLPSQRRLLSSVSNTSYGYFCGGLDDNSIGVCTISRLDFTNETVSDPNKNLPGRRTDSAATSSNLYGYIAGGYDSSGYSSIARLDFSTEVVDAPATRNLPASLAPLYSLAATSSQYYGYFAGGLVPTGVSISNVTKLDFSNETATLQPAPQSLPTARSNLTAVSNSN